MAATVFEEWAEANPAIARAAEADKAIHELRHLRELTKSLTPPSLLAPTPEVIKALDQCEARLRSL